MVRNVKVHCSVPQANRWIIHQFHIPQIATVIIMISFWRQNTWFCRQNVIWRENDYFCYLGRVSLSFSDTEEPRLDQRLVWTQVWKVAEVRFDCMGHLETSNSQQVIRDVSSLTFAPFKLAFRPMLLSRASSDLSSRLDPTRSASARDWTIEFLRLKTTGPVTDSESSRSRLVQPSVGRIDPWPRVPHLAYFLFYLPMSFYDTRVFWKYYCLPEMTYCCLAEHFSKVYATGCLSVSPRNPVRPSSSILLYMVLAMVLLSWTSETIFAVLANY